ncbi:type III-B CRISPR-associated protein Cas10/Cmr2 [Spirulina sp. CS-785/01]|uniref:type III-B CRISPR-associated protein Cas10/Cmr2 n=1 Tax=Spirulina sp. CS-785/01 TaxID=3021716 RepID=UPI00232BF029|nr:type III-B CRISPR-associated protein Cas10/Cmr2 [Spirulina sp. CS-785/01]MDB9313727.1 type III-B CRISPR-associated protein Cas10/Cmr2 [Spirulina sp. CS-785/01]
MSNVYWQAKIWGLLHDPALKGLHNNTGRGDNSFWLDLEAMADWKDNNWNPESKSGKIFQHLKNADYITSASDRGAIANLNTSVNYNDQGLKISHLLSGEQQDLKLPETHHQEILSNRKNYLQQQEQDLRNSIPTAIRNDPKRLFWWLWRCLPETTCQNFNDPSLLLLPAETRFPDGSIWSHASLTAALAGAFIGYNATPDLLANPWPANAPLPHAYLATFSFSPVQQLIKASRKMRDFWAGSWLLHYLSAKVCWTLAKQYGPDCFLYPSLFQQPLIDHWLRQEFGEWVKQPSDRSLLTAGFPNVLLLILPKEKVAAAMQTAKSTLLQEWRQVAHLVFTHLKEKRHWTRQLQETDRTWTSWLEAQWQIYWTAVPIGKEGETLKSSEIYQDDTPQATQQKAQQDQDWCERQNEAYGLTGKQALFLQQELDFLRKSGQHRKETQHRNPCAANVGSWWAAIFDQNRYSLAAVKNARNWQLPTVFGPRSTISGLGSVVYPDHQKKRNQAGELTDWVTERETRNYWTRNAGLFDGIEELNATETVKRGLEKVLPDLLGIDNEQGQTNIAGSYPDLTAGVAGFLKTGTSEQLQHFRHACQDIQQKIIQDHRKIPDLISQSWGIPWIDTSDNEQYSQYHPRVLNAGWLVEELELPEEEVRSYRNELQQRIDRHYPNNNPANWYVLAAGDGDGMGDWLKGTKMKQYQAYFPETLTIPDPVKPEFEEFKQLQKRMGPSTHNALSRALLDFSNQLLPYLTEQRYAGRLIYGGGDDVLAYTNLWEWDSWLWDVRQCFKGDKDPHGEFDETGDYWRPKTPINGLSDRPLFTMGEKATISFGLVMAHHSVPLAIALENLWEAEDDAKDHVCINEKGEEDKKDAVQVRVIYGNGNILKATTKFETFAQWRALLNLELEPALFESAAQLWEQHPVPHKAAISPWVQAFVSRREVLKDDEKQERFTQQLTAFLEKIWEKTLEKQLEQEVKNWFKLAAFVLRNSQVGSKELSPFG